ncbi:NAD(P)-binding protein [Streptomyces sp. SID486]|uniref:FAD-dependent oxidoreductase n=1 Tax=Streptomyces sp. SID486 TaxID=2690264 RepID=UPI00136D339B|nr:NAD(P)-binding protein [Streptomyces sp. SID486]
MGSRRSVNGWDAVVVGAGLAGLACARDLGAAGLRVRVLEAQDGVGGRMRSDLVDGCVVDRGFQVFNTAYPQVRRRLPLRELRLRPFTPGFLVHTGRRRLRFADPTRAPRQALRGVGGGVAGPRDLAALATLTGRDMLAPAALVRRARDTSTRRALAAAGFSEGFVERFFRPFLSGVFLEEDLATSSRFFHLVWRSMARGTICLPAAGVAAVPELLASALPPGTLALESPVTALTDDGVVVDGGREVAARAVVVASSPTVAAALLPGLPLPPYRTVTTYYHLTPRSPLREPTLVTDVRRRFTNSCVLTEVQPGHAPRGYALVATSVLGADTAGRERTLRDALAECYGTDTGGWELLTARTVAEALPAMEPGLPLSRRSRRAAGRYVCGDHRATGSVQGALASGARAAREVVADLAGA